MSNIFSIFVALYSIVTDMKLNIVKSKNCTILYAARSYRSESGKSTSKVVKRLGTVEELREKLNGEDPIEWARTQVAGMTALEKEENKHVIIDCNPMALIPKGEQRSYNGGYLFLQKIYYELGLDYICKKIAKKHKLLKYDLNGILSMLVYTRILYPGSKRSSLEDARKFLEQPECALEQVYRALSLLAGEFNEIQAGVYKRSLKLGKRNTRVVYYDLTNYFFECEEESGLRQYGHSKENRPLPIVQMGLFMDRDGFPVYFTPKVYQYFNPKVYHLKLICKLVLLVLLFWRYRQNSNTNKRLVLLFCFSFLSLYIHHFFCFFNSV